MKLTTVSTGAVLWMVGVIVSLHAADISVSDNSYPTGGVCVGDNVTLNITGEQDTPPDCNCGGTATYDSSDYDWEGDVYSSGDVNYATLATALTGPTTVTCTINETFDCDDGSQVYGTENASMPSTTVHDNDTSSPTCPSPASGSYGLPNFNLSSAEISDTIDPVAETDTQVVENGSCTGATANESFAADGAVIPNPCGESWTGTKAGPTVSIGINIGIFSLAITGTSVNGTAPSNPAVPYQRNFGQWWDYNVTPASTAFSGTQTTYVYSDPDPFTGQYQHVDTTTQHPSSLSLAGSGATLLGYVGTVTTLDCCPTGA